ncbi:MAG: Trx7/PDZ domain-containing (seleno)protein [Gemmataceae bacterium]
MDCRDFDGQVVRLEGIRDIADKFVRVRLTRIDGMDLNLFEFDYDLTFMVFFLNKDKEIYGRYGGRDSESADSRQSLEGLKYAMQSVLGMHEREDKAFAPKSESSSQFIKEFNGRKSKGCMHCHQVKEALDSELHRLARWSRDNVWRYPLPENLGIILEVNRGDRVKEIKAKSPAAEAGLRKGDVLKRLNGVPIHSFADAQYALDIAPGEGTIPIIWQRDGKDLQEKLALPQGWRKTDASWRPSVRHLIPSARLGGADLTAAERKRLGLSEKQLAFRESEPVSRQAQEAGIRAGDIILGLDEAPLEMNLNQFQDYVRGTFLIGDKLTIVLLRDGKRTKATMTLLR